MKHIRAVSKSPLTADAKGGSYDILEFLDDLANLVSGIKDLLLAF